jgi:ornithine cyclodeaminase/alanine dehydrogenase-like protein (mu-crystallin family)
MPLLIDNATVSELLKPAEFVAAISEAYRGFAIAQGVCAPRLDLQATPKGAETYQLGVVAGITGRYACLRIKSDVTYLREVDGIPRKEKYAVAPGIYCGLLLLFSTENGAPLALLHDGILQQMRVGADSAIGVSLLARPNARVLGILGSGGMATSHLRAICAVIQIDRVLVYSPTKGNAARFAAEAAEIGYPVQAASSAAEVAAQADILCACTNAIGPVVLGQDIRPGTHLTAIGGSLDSLASKRVDRWLRLGLATAAPEWGGEPIEQECLTFSRTGAKATSGGTRQFADIPKERRVMLADLLHDPTRGRQSDQEITFSDRGNIHGIQFAAAAGHIYERALASGMGRPMGMDVFTQSIRN